MFDVDLSSEEEMRSYSGRLVQVKKKNSKPEVVTLRLLSLSRLNDEKFGVRAMQRLLEMQPMLHDRFA